MSRYEPWMKEAIYARFEDRMAFAEIKAKEIRRGLLPAEQPPPKRHPRSWIKPR